MKRNWSSLEWHKNGLAAYQRTLEEKKKQLERLRIEVAVMEKKASFWEGLIYGAESKGDDGFDIKRLDRFQPEIS
jgi:hypothetical protein